MNLVPWLIRDFYIYKSELEEGEKERDPQQIEEVLLEYNIPVTIYLVVSVN